MSIFFRKSKKIGPFQINLSKSGIGVSAGVKGARVSIGPTGTFVHVGMNGVQYRKKINSSKKTEHEKEEINLNEVFSKDYEEQTITTNNFSEITDSESQEFIQDLEKQDKKPFLFKWLGLLPMLFCLLTFYYLNADRVQNIETIKSFFKITASGANIRETPNSKGEIRLVSKRDDAFEIIEIEGNWIKIKVDATIGYVHNSVGKSTEKKISKKSNVPNTKNNISYLWLLVFIPIIIGLILIDKKRKRIDIIYSMDDEFLGLYEAQKAYFKEFKMNKKIWQKKTTKRVKNSKYHAGAGSLIKREKVNLVEIDSLPTPLIKTNIQIPHISLSNIDFYFFPERLVLKQSGKFAAVFYKNVSVKSTSIRFIEDEKVPSDAKIIDRTWKYVNKKGGADKRFKDNRQIPICLYSEYHFKCKNGINEIIMTSKVEGMENFMLFFNKIGEIQQKYDNLIS